MVFNQWIKTEAIVKGFGFGYYTLMINQQDCMVDHETMHKYCSFPSLTDEDGNLKPGSIIKVILKPSKTSGKIRVFPDHEFYHKNNSLSKEDVCNHLGVNRYEDQYTEFKQSLNFEEVAHQVAGFINAQCEGHIVCGLTDQTQEVVGVTGWENKSEDYVQSKMAEFLNYIKTNIFDGDIIISSIKTQLLKYNEKWLLLITVPLLKDEFALFKGEQVFMRIGSSLHQLKNRSLLEFFKSRYYCGSENE